jgi:hypothetical protein
MPISVKEIMYIHTASYTEPEFVNLLRKFLGSLNVYKFGLCSQSFTCRNIDFYYTRTGTHIVLVCAYIPENAVNFLTQT